MITTILLWGLTIMVILQFFVINKLVKRFYELGEGLIHTQKQLKALANIVKENEETELKEMFDAMSQHIN